MLSLQAQTKSHKYRNDRRRSMTADVRLAGVGTVLLLVSSGLLTQTAIDGRLSMFLAAIAMLGALATAFRVSSPTA
ncbi:hypothetical protein C439_04925 [Haloferax mediterranei ATCC 33500]|uniref:Uncharacterized protein n=2 Tax=Haloferacaceae TaxID=1644056 RepID=M0J4N8_HALMT|nr:hypothetical protein C439_04925 [Haloferax mediterranei ATCC 33500]